MTWREEANSPGGSANDIEAFVNPLRKGLLALALCAAVDAGAAGYRVLVYTKAVGFVHASTPAGIQCLQELGGLNGFTVDISQDTAAITPANLAKYAAVVFLNTYGTVFGSRQEQAFQGYLQGGGGWVGVHAAVNCETGWAWFGGLLGNGAWRNGERFGNFPNIRESKSHAIVRDLPDTLTFNEEYYGYKTNPRTAVDVLYRADESPADKTDHPSAWAHEYAGGRAAFMVWGHYDATYLDPGFRKFLANAILWAAHRDAVAMGKTPSPSSFPIGTGTGLSISRQTDGLRIYLPLAGTHSLRLWNEAGKLLLVASFQGGRATDIRIPDGGSLGVILARIDGGSDGSGRETAFQGRILPPL